MADPAANNQNTHYARIVAWIENNADDPLVTAAYDQLPPQTDDEFGKELMRLLVKFEAPPNAGPALIGYYEQGYIPPAGVLSPINIVNTAERTFGLPPEREIYEMYFPDSPPKVMLAINPYASQNDMRHFIATEWPRLEAELAKYRPIPRPATVRGGLNTKSLDAQVSKLHDEGLKIEEIELELDISRATVFKSLNRVKHQKDDPNKI